MDKEFFMTDEELREALSEDNITIVTTELIDYFRDKDIHPMAAAVAMLSIVKSLEADGVIEIDIQEILEDKTLGEQKETH